MSAAPEPISPPHPELDPPHEYPTAYGFSTGPYGDELDDAPWEKFYVSQMQPVTHLARRLASNVTACLENPCDYRGVHVGCNQLRRLSTHEYSL